MDERPTAVGARMVNLLTLVAALAVAIGLGELAARRIAPQDMSGSWFEYGPRGLALNRSDGTVRDQVGRRVVRYHFVAPHLRGDDPPSADAIRILVLGDSFTFGWRLADGDTFLADLQRRADAAFGDRRVQFLNCGVGGWGTADELAYLEAFGSQVGPHAVLVVVSFDDAGRARRSSLYRLHASGMVEPADASARRSRIKMLSAALPGYSYAIEHSHLAQLVRRSLLSWTLRDVEVEHAVDTAAARDERTQRLVRALFARMKTWTDAHGATLIVTTTGWPSVDYPWLAGRLADAGLDLIDLGPEVAPVVARDRTAYELDTVHPNERGAALIASALWPHLRATLEALVRANTRVPRSTWQ